MAYDRLQQKVSMDEAIGRLAGRELASPSRYWVAFSLPEGIVAKTGGNDNVNGVSEGVQGANIRQFSSAIGDIGFMCSQMSFPSRSLMTTDHRHIGTPIRMPYGASYTDVTFTFQCSSDLRERKYFEAWQQSIVNVSMNSLNFYKEYVRPVHLMQLNKRGDVTYQVTLVEAYPIVVGEINNSFAAKDEISLCTITMAYRHWINQDIR